MKKIIGKGKKFNKKGHYKVPEYVQGRLNEFVEKHHQHFGESDWIWKDFSDLFGQESVNTVRNWYHEGIPNNQLYFVHLVLEKRNY